MTDDRKQQLILTILRNESLRPLSRIQRLFKDPIRALPYYLLATVARIRPFAITFRTLWDTKMTCFLPEGNTFYYYGYCEANLTNLLVRYLTPGMQVLDVGAHVGIYSMLAAELIGKEGRVISFEPTPWTFTLLQKNTNGLTNVTILNKAISDTEKVLTFADYGPGYGAYNSAHAGGAPDIQIRAQKISVPSISLSTFCSENSIKPDFIKIDSEGFEHEVLLGSLELLQTTAKKRPLVSIEVAGGTTWAQNNQQAFSILTSLSYDPYEISPEGLLTPHTLQASYAYDNLLFLPRERREECKELFV